MSALSPSQQPTVLFSIYQNNIWTFRCLVDETIDPATQLTQQPIDPATQRIVLKIVGFLIRAKVHATDLCHPHDKKDTDSQLSQS